MHSGHDCRCIIDGCYMFMETLFFVFRYGWMDALYFGYYGDYPYFSATICMVGGIVIDYLAYALFGENGERFFIMVFDFLGGSMASDTFCNFISLC